MIQPFLRGCSVDLCLLPPVSPPNLQQPETRPWCYPHRCNDPRLVLSKRLCHSNIQSDCTSFEQSISGKSRSGPRSPSVAGTPLVSSTKTFWETIIEMGNFYHGVAMCSCRKCCCEFFTPQAYFWLHWANHSDLGIIGKIFSSCKSWACMSMMPILVKGDDIRGGTKANACRGWLRVAQESMG